jgi:hypothetical protein
MLSTTLPLRKIEAGGVEDHHQGIAEYYNKNNKAVKRRRLSAHGLDEQYGQLSIDFAAITPAVLDV